MCIICSGVRCPKTAVAGVSRPASVGGGEVGQVALERAPDALRRDAMREEARAVAELDTRVEEQPGLHRSLLDEGQLRDSPTTAQEI